MEKIYIAGEARDTQAANRGSGSLPQNFLSNDGYRRIKVEQGMDE